MNPLPPWVDAMSGWLDVGHDILVDALRRERRLIIVSESGARTALADQLSRIPSSINLNAGERPAGRTSDSDPEATVVGFGGGAALDWAKLVASETGFDLVLVPTVTSTNSIFTSSMRERDESGRAGEVHRADPRLVILDLAVLTTAPRRINAAGLADVLAVETALLDWIDTQAGEEDDREISTHSSLVEDLVDALAGLARAYDPSDEAQCLETLRLLYESVRLMESSGGPLGAGYEHLFAWNLERVTGRKFVHGEAVALGIVVAHLLRGRSVARPLTVLDGAGVLWRPHQLGIDDEDVARVVASVGEYNRAERHLDVPLADRSPGREWRDWLREAS